MSKDRYKWVVVGLLWCISFFNYADREAIFSLFPLLQKEMHLTPVQLGLLGSGFAWVYGLTAPFAGSIVDRVRRKRTILGGLYAWSTIAILTPVSRTFQQLFGFMAAEGLGETFYYPASMSMISNYHGKQTRSRAMGGHQTSVYLDRRGFLCRSDRRTLWRALVVHRLRKPGDHPWICIAPAVARAGTRRGRSG